MNGRVKKEDDIIMWLSNHNQTIRAGEWAVLFRLEETEFQKSIVQMYSIQGTVFLYGSILVVTYMVPKFQWHSKQTLTEV